MTSEFDEPEEVAKVRRALRAIYLEVPTSVARDLARVVLDAMAAAWDEGYTYRDGHGAEPLAGDNRYRSREPWP